MLKKLKAYNANVKIIGKDWQDANDAAVEYLKTHPEVGFIHPYDHPVIFEGHSSMVEEIKEDLNGEKPSCIVTSVGGGGLAMGIIHGLEKQEWSDVPLLCMETIGADCFNKSIAAGEIVEVRLTSIAKTLGARTVTPTMWEAQKSFNVLSAVLPDKDAVNGCIRLAGKQFDYLYFKKIGNSKTCFLLTFTRRPRIFGGTLLWNYTRFYLLKSTSKGD